MSGSFHPKFSGFGFWLNLAFAAVLLGWGASAHAQCTAKTGTINVTSYGGNLSPSIALGNTSPGTCWEVTYTLVDTSGYPLRFIWNNTSTQVVVLSSANMVLTASSIPQDVTLQPGQSFTITFTVGVPATGTAVTGASAQIFYSVGRVYDQVWNDADFDGGCDLLDISDTVLASSGATTGDVGGGGGGRIIPGCVDGHDATFINDLAFPINVYYAGYTDSGTIAPYIGGTLCGVGSTQFCDGDWVDGITLQPGEASGLFTILVGMPYYIGNESKNTTGTFEFAWIVVPVPIARDDGTTTALDTPVTINALANDTLAATAGDVPIVYTVTLGGTTGGTWLVNDDNTVTFTPDAGFTGNATAQYTLTSHFAVNGAPHTQTATAAITVTVQGTSPPPPPPPASPSIPVPALGDEALALLLLSMAGIGARRMRRGSEP